MIEGIKNLKEQEEFEKQEYLKELNKLCEANKNRISQMREIINKWSDSEDKHRILSLLEDVEKAHTDPSFIHDLVELDRTKLGTQEPKPVDYHDLFNE